MGNLFDEEYNNAFEAFETSLMGVTFDGRQVICKQLYEGAILDLIREPNNSYDPNAIGVYYNNQSCGYIDKNHATRLAPLIDQGNYFVAVVTQTTGGGNYSYGARIRITEERKLVGPDGKDEVSFSSNWDDWLDDDQKKLQDSSDTESEYDVQAVFTPTDEQRTILKYEVQDNSVINIIAFAGTGKTTTLLEYAKKRPETSFLYIAFNDSVRQEGIIRFPNNVVCHTSHSLAWSVMKKYYGHKIIVGNLRPIEIKEILNIRQIDEAIIVSNIIQRFLISTDSTFKNTHLPANIEDDKNKKRHYLEMAIKLWVYMINQDFNGKMTFDCYLKLYQLSKPKIEYDYILLDEAQDTNPVVADIILSQTCRKIFVGDPHQQIYAFRGARDAMEKIIAAKSFYLTHSFRFGKEIGECQGSCHLNQN